MGKAILKIKFCNFQSISNEKDNTNYSTDIGDIFEFRIDLDEFEPVNILVQVTKKRFIKLTIFLMRNFVQYRLIMLIYIIQNLK